METADAGDVTYCSEWDSAYGGGFSSQYPFECVIRFVFDLKKHFPGGRVLEVGCGTGGNLVCISEQGFAPYGIDAAATAVVKCRAFLAGKRLPANVSQSRIDRLEYPDEFFVGVVDRATISHVGNVEAGANADNGVKTG